MIKDFNKKKQIAWGHISTTASRCREASFQRAPQGPTLSTKAIQAEFEIFGTEPQTLRLLYSDSNK